MRGRSRRLNEIVCYLDDLLEMEKYRGEREHEGLLVEGKPSVRSIGLGVNLSLQTIGQAVGRDLDLLVTHHPASLFTDGYLYEDKYRISRDSRLSLYVAHKPLDQAKKFGTACSFASAIGLKVEGELIRDPKTGKYSGVFGLAGANLKDLTQTLESMTGKKPLVRMVSKRLGRIAVVTGWGGRPEWIDEAKNLGCNTFLTGEALMFGRLVARELGVNMILASHYASEVPGVKALAQKIEKHFKINTQFLEEENMG